MAPGMSALLALMLAASPYQGHGTEPFWGVTITGHRVVYESADGPHVVAVVRPRPIRGGRIYESRRLTVEIRRGECNDGMSDRYQADTVRVWLGRRTGGGLEAWGIVVIDGETVRPAEDYNLQFIEGLIHGQAGCNRFSGPYREAIRTLTPGPIMATRMACPEPRMRHEQRVLQLLSGPLRFSYPDGDTLVLAGNGGMIRLDRQ
jgi:heat shock protein HslJ